MAGLTRTVHPVSNVEWGSIDKIAGDLGMRVTDDNNGGEPKAPKALWFVDPDGETHVYVFSDQGRVELIRMLTGGLVVPGG